MKLLILLLFPVFCYSQNRLYAVRLNTDNTSDSFYVRAFGGDSIFNSSNVYVARTVEYYSQFFEPVIPNGFGKYFKCGDGIYRNIKALTGNQVSVITVHGDASANLVLTNHPNSEQALSNSNRSAVRVNTTAFSEARLTCVVMASSASVNNPRIYFQYSSDGVNWNGSTEISLSSTGAKETAWVTLPGGAIGDVFVRVAQNGGDGVADPALGTVTIQLR